MLSSEQSSSQHNLSHPAVHPVASCLNGNYNVRDEKSTVLEQDHAEVSDSVFSDPGLNPHMMQHSDLKTPSGPGLIPQGHHTNNAVTPDTEVRP